MEHLRPSSPFEQSLVYHLASTWLNPGDDQEVFAWLLAITHPDPEQRRKTVFQMIQQRDASVRVPLLVALHDPGSRVRGEAAHAMIFFRDARAVEPLSALHDPDRSVQTAIRKAIDSLRARAALSSPHASKA